VNKKKGKKKPGHASLPAAGGRGEKGKKAKGNRHAPSPESEKRGESNLIANIMTGKKNWKSHPTLGNKGGKGKRKEKFISERCSSCPGGKKARRASSPAEKKKKEGNSNPRDRPRRGREGKKGRGEVSSRFAEKKIRDLDAIREEGRQGVVREVPKMPLLPHRDSLLSHLEDRRERRIQCTLRGEEKKENSMLIEKKDGIIAPIRSRRR